MNWLAALAADPPETVDALGRALGWSLEDVAAGAQPDCGPLSLRVEWDVHHERPLVEAEQFRGRRVLEWRLALGEHRQAYAQVLTRAFGAPRPVHERERYGPFFLSAHALEWYAQTPDWAQRGVDPTHRAAALVALASGGAPPDGAGLVPNASGGARLEPSAPALELARALEIEDPVAVSVGVHMDSWRLDGPHGLQLWLDGWPSGESVGPPGPIGHRRIGPEDRIGAVDVRR